MAETIDKVSERLTRLEVTVAKGFHETSQQFERVHSQFERVHSQFEGVHSQFEGVRSQFEDVNAKFKSVDQRLDAVDQRLDAVDQRLDAVDQRFDAVDQRFDAVDRRFDDVDRRFHEAELRDIALSRKVDVTTEALRGDIRNVMDAVTSLGEEMRRTTDSIRKEHADDRAVLTTAIENHARRLHTLEQKR